MSNGDVNVALFCPRPPIFSLGQNRIQQHHNILLHSLNYMAIDSYCKGNAGVA
jgi:hypothetical protein